MLVCVGILEGDETTSRLILVTKSVIVRQNTNGMLYVSGNVMSLILSIAAQVNRVLEITPSNNDVISHGELWRSKSYLVANPIGKRTDFCAALAQKGYQSHMQAPIY